MSETVFRWSGLLLILGAALLGSATVLVSMNPEVSQGITPPIRLLLLLSSISLLLSLPAMYAKQATQSGWLGLIGHGLLQTGILLLVLVAAPALLFPSLGLTLGEDPVVFFLGIAFTFGLLLTGIATVRARVYPTRAGILLLTAMAGFFFDFFVAEFLPPIVGQIGIAFLGVLLALSLAWIGFAMWAGQRQLTRTSGPLSA